MVEKAEKRDTRYDLWDLELAGFRLWVETIGTKNFIIRYRIEGGGRSAPRWIMTVARYGEREKEGQSPARGGGAPAGDVWGKRREKTVKELLDFYEEHRCFIQRGIHKCRPMKPMTKR